MKPYSCIIVDDEEIYRLFVLSYVKRFPELLSVAGVFETAGKALSFLENNQVDVAFLDIELKHESGLKLRKKSLEIPACVFISSHYEVAAKTFELQTLDFIVKPFDFKRFEQAVKRIEEFMELRLKADLFDATLGGDAIYVKSGHEQIKLKMHEILYLEALKNYTLIFTESKRHCILSNLGEMLQDENFSSFVRIHRSFAVQREFITKIGSSEVMLNNKFAVPIGRSFKDNLNTVL